MQYDLSQNRNILDFIQKVLEFERDARARIFANRESNTILFSNVPTSRTIQVEFDGDFSISYTSSTEFQIQHKNMKFNVTASFPNYTHSIPERVYYRRLKEFTTFISSIVEIHSFLTMIHEISYIQLEFTYNVVLDNLRNYRKLKAFQNNYSNDSNRFFYVLEQLNSAMTIPGRQPTTSAWSNYYDRGRKQGIFHIGTMLPDILKIKVADLKILELKMNQSISPQQALQMRFITFALDQYPRTKERIMSIIRRELFRSI